MMGWRGGGLGVKEKPGLGLHTGGAAPSFNPAAQPEPLVLPHLPWSYSNKLLVVKSSLPKTVAFPASRGASGF